MNIVFTDTLHMLVHRFRHEQKYTHGHVDK